jgi:hypothetical protein
LEPLLDTNFYLCYLYKWELITMSEKYRLMTYFAVATLHFYRADIVAVRGPQTVEQFVERNEDIIKRVCDEAVSLFNYELSIAQVGHAVMAYLTPGQSVANTKVATIP